MIYPPRLQTFFVYSFYAALLTLTILFLAPTQFLSDVIFNWWDKAQHAMAFGVLTALAILAYPKKVTTPFWLMLLYGALIEVLQSLSGWRQGDFSDWYADAIGVALSCSLAYLLKNVFRGRRLF